MSTPPDLPTITLVDAVKAEATVVCARAPLARHLNSQFGRITLAGGNDVWRTPSIYSWAAWIRRQHDGLLDLGLETRRVLSNAEEQLVWEDVISGWDAYGRLLQVDGAAESAARATRLCVRHQIKRAALTRGHGPETSIFLSWLAQFEARLERNQWCTSAALDARVAAALSAGNLAAPAVVVLAGFDQPSAIEQQVLDALRDRGSTLYTLAPNALAKQVDGIIAPDLEHELDAVVRWILDQIEIRPNVRLGIAAPEPNRIRAGLDDRLREYVRADEQHIYQFDSETVLASNGAVHDALLWLRLVVSAQSRDVVLHLLRSNLLRAPAESPEASPETSPGAATTHSRGELLRDTNDTTIEDPFDVSFDDPFNDPRDHIEYESAPDPSGPPIDSTPIPSSDPIVGAGYIDQHITQINFRTADFATLVDWLTDGFAGSPLTKRWRRVLSDRAAKSTKASLREWSTRFASWLKLAGWPGDATDLSGIRDRFTEALGELARLSQLHPECDGRSAVERFQRVCQSVAVERALDAQIQVVSIADASHMHFDALWVAGLDDGQWPPAANASALLPIVAQRNADVPGASPNAALALAERVTSQLLRAAMSVTLSYAAADGEREQRASPLLHLALGSSEQPKPLPPTVAPKHEALFDHLEWCDDANGVPVVPGVVSGGARLLADQSACPFRAYAVHRLGVDAADTPGLGLDRRDAGTLLHRVLELVWDELKTSSQLQTCTDDYRQKIVNSAVEQAIREQARKSSALSAPRYRGVESTRLIELTNAWLDFEQTRQTPFTVLEQESTMLLDLGPLSVKVRVDRVDQMADGCLVVIDYKSGSVKANNWEEERLREPQVPLYAVSQPQAVGGAFLAQVRSESVRFAGLTRDKNYVPKSGRSVVAVDAQSWDDRVDSWRQQLHGLAQEVAGGLAVVVPQHGPSTCRYCHLRAACRIDESSA